MIVPISENKSLNSFVSILIIDAICTDLREGFSCECKKGYMGPGKA